eukprot:NODE_2114_length_984_cov_136.424599_g1730_i0.p1 GENE.NODE_2114_length_984_cov_136.424599_g1730_i0~~NODE_2114_length_984_cov_136.424599_g1730_i0.p1  ORF type:complete len:154 (-),score=40.33 NODE_2114_length_984_cov_136.424599_g1730_i0:256-717(-)
MALWLRTAGATMAPPEVCGVPDSADPPKRRQLMLFGLRMGVPFIGFGFMDNSIMLLAGEMIDNYISLYGFTALASAALGNIVSGWCGLATGELFESAVSKIGLPPHHLTVSQHRMWTTRAASLMGCLVGITIGCLMGMFPLLLHREKRERKSA